MTPVKSNFTGMYSDLSCEIKGCDKEQNQSHLLKCDSIIIECQELYDDVEVEHEDIFSKPEKQLKAAKLYQAIFKTIDRILDN